MDTIGTARAGAAQDAALERALAGVSRNVLPACFLAFLFCLLDRINVGYAALTMNAELGLTPAMFGFGSAIFYLG